MKIYVKVSYEETVDADMVRVYNASSDDEKAKTVEDYKEGLATILREDFGADDIKIEFRIEE